MLNRAMKQARVTAMSALPHLLCVGLHVRAHETHDAGPVALVEAIAQEAFSTTANAAARELTLYLQGAIAQGIATGPAPSC